MIEIYDETLIVVCARNAAPILLQHTPDVVCHTAVRTTTDVVLEESAPEGPFVPHVIEVFLRAGSGSTQLTATQKILRTLPCCSQLAHAKVK